MVDGVLLLVDASEGPLPQTRFVLRKALEARLPVILVVNKVDRPDARIAEVVDEVYELFLDLDADESQIEFPIVYTQRAGPAGPALDADELDGTDLAAAASTCSSSTIPAPEYEPRATRCRRSSPTSTRRPYVGRLALCRVRNGTIRKGQQVAWCRADGTIERAKVTELYVTEALDRVDADEAGPGEIVAVAGIPEVTIGETLADPDDPRPLPVITVDEPSLSMTIGINTSPLAGQDGDKLTARHGARAGSTQELVGNVSLRVLADRAARHLGGAGPRRAPARGARRDDAPRGLRADRRQAAGRHPRGRRQGARAGRARSRSTCPRTTSASSPSCSRCARAGWSRWSTTAPAGCGMEYLVPARGLIGFRTEFLTETRGTGHPPPRLRALRAVARRAAHAPDRQRSSPTAAARRPRFALLNLQERGTLFVGPGVEVYEGMIVGENARADDMDVNADQGEEAHEHALVDRRRARAADPAAAALARAGARVHRATTSASRSRPTIDPPAQGRARRLEAPVGGEPQGPRARRSRRLTARQYVVAPPVQECPDKGHREGTTMEDRPRLPGSTRGPARSAAEPLALAREVAARDPALHRARASSGSRFSC